MSPGREAAKAVDTLLAPPQPSSAVFSIWAYLASGPEATDTEIPEIVLILTSPAQGWGWGNLKATKY